MKELMTLVGIFPILSPYLALYLALWGGIAHDRRPIAGA